MKQVDIRSIIIPNRPRSGNYPTGTTVTPGGGSNSTVINQGGGVDLTQARKEFLSKKTFDTANGTIDFLKGLMISGRMISELLQEDSSGDMSDEAIMSAAKVLLEITNAVRPLDSKFLRKDQGDSTKYLIKFLKGIELGEYLPGVIGTGAAITIDENGESHAEFDYLTIRKIALFAELMIQQSKYVGGQIIVSPTAMTVSKIEETSDAYRCYFENTDGEKILTNQFTIGAQARRQTFNLKEQAYYWRLVTSIGDNYIELSKTDADEGSTIPQVGDEIVQFGHRTDLAMQSAIVISGYGTGSPSIIFYQGIDSYDLTGKDIKSDYFDVTTGRLKSVEYGDKYTGARDRSTYFEYTQDGGTDFKGKANIQAGSTGVGNFSDLPEELQKAIKIGAENLLMNTSFAGNYEPISLVSETRLSAGQELYSSRLIGWDGNATVIEDEEATSGYSAQIGKISQGALLILGENYVISYKAKGTSVKLEIGNVAITQNLTGNYSKYSHVFTAGEETVVSISGPCTICDIKLERGTIATDWCPSVNDPSKDKEGFKALFDIQTALKGKTQFYGGLGLTTMIQLGVWENDILTKINAGISGIWNNDQDVAYWAGGTYEQAIATVNKIINGETPTDDDWKQLAKFVVTHGGDVFIRGYIYALGGVFRGTIYAQDGEFNGLVKIANGKILLNKDGSGKLSNGNIEWDSEGNTKVTGTLSAKVDGYEIKISPTSEFRVPSIEFIDTKSEATFSIYLFNEGLGRTPRIAMKKYTGATMVIDADRISMQEEISGNRFGTLICAGFIQLTKNDEIKWEQKLY